MSAGPYLDLARIRVACNAPAGQDTEAQTNRTMALEWLYHIDQRQHPAHPQHGLYTGLWLDFQEKVKAGL